MYVEVDVIILGALDRHETFDEDIVGLQQFLFRVEKEAKEHGEHTEVYITEHDHELSEEECACVQYQQSHNPTYVYN